MVVDHDSDEESRDVELAYSGDKRNGAVVPSENNGSVVHRKGSSRVCTKLKINNELEKHSSSACECAYFLLLNVGSRFLASHTHIPVEISRIAKYLVLCGVIGVPGMFFCNFAVTVLGYTCAIPNSTGFQPWIIGLNCVTQKIYVYGSLGTFTIYVTWTVSLAVMIVTIVGK